MVTSWRSKTDFLSTDFFGSVASLEFVDSLDDWEKFRDEKLIFFNLSTAAKGYQKLIVIVSYKRCVSFPSILSDGKLTVGKYQQIAFSSWNSRRFKRVYAINATN